MIFVGSISKKVKHIIITLFLAVSISCFFACNKTENTTETSTALPPVSTSITTLQDDLKLLLPQNDYRTIYNDIESWEQLVREKFEININVDYISRVKFQSYITGDYLRKIIDNGYDGLIYLWQNIESLTRTLADEKYITNLTNYLTNNEVYNSLPDILKEKYFMDNNEIWALPAMYRIVPLARLVKTEWLDTLSLDTPKNVDEFYNTAKLFTYNDPNKSKSNDTYGIAITPGYELLNLMDLFLANGCYVDSAGFSSITFDRQTMTYEDALLKPSAIETLEIIQSMANEGIIKKVHYNNSSGFEQSSTEGSYYNYINSIENTDSHTIVWCLTGTQSKNICTAMTGKGSYVLSSQNKEPQKTIDLFLNTFLGSPDGYYTAFAGVEGVDYKLNGKDFIELDRTSSIRVLEEFIPYLKLNDYSYHDGNQNEKLKNTELLIKSVKNLYETGKLFFMGMIDGPYDITPPHSASKVVEYIINGKGSVDEIIEEYKSTMKKYGMQQKIDDMNINISGSTNFYY